MVVQPTPQGVLYKYTVIFDKFSLQKPTAPTSHRLNKPDQNLPVFLILQWKAKERGRGQGQCSSKEDRSRRSPAVLSPSAAELGWPGEPRLTAAGAPAGALAPAVPAKRSHRSREGGTTQRSNYPAIQRSSSSRALPASPGCSGTALQQAWREPRPGRAERGRAGRAVTLRGWLRASGVTVGGKARAGPGSEAQRNFGDLQYYARLNFLQKDMVVPPEYLKTARTAAGPGDGEGTSARLGF
ncbi:uncharacterized protein LOC116441700 [Corvus moneduloides]|uniref:uncharacterized protein LOC116441700 n=1 Tax=Corvus moneduloides TaxID=1196302 RepID=UPI001362B352|nr:uncharacterized protein LOC116441700 [Corvus moneduloides]